MKQRFGLVLFACLLVTSCTTPEEEPEDPQERVPVFASHVQEGLERVWTERFSKPAVLIADEIRIDGPKDLLQHVAIAQDPEVFEFTTRTTPRGLEQVAALKPGFEMREIRAHLDSWTVVAMRRLIVLQRPGEAPVRIQAIGNAALLQGDNEERSGQIVIRGDHGTP